MSLLRTVVLKRFQIQLHFVPGLLVEQKSLQEPLGN